MVKLEARGSRFDEIEPSVRKIVDDVRGNGDRALRTLSKVGQLIFRQARCGLATGMKAAWKSARALTSSAPCAQRRRTFASFASGKYQCTGRTRGGISLGQLVLPLDSVGCYVPGGRYPLVSTLLMTVIPAQVAGCAEYSRGFSASEDGGAGCGWNAGSA